jgi:F420-dependent oxidoreductase-like protein
MALRIFTEPQQGASYEQLLTFAKAAEDGGFDAFFRSDHVLAMGSATGLPAVTDAWITLAGLARDTSTIRLGTLVTPVTFRAPGMFAVSAAQVDQMSGGRLEIGLGAGWYGDEHTAFGLPFPPVGERYDLLEDQLAILDAVWSAAPGETFSFTGKTTTVEIEADTIRPAQQPRPPIVLGGQGKTRSAAMAVAYADEYNTAFVPVDAMRTVHDRIRKACEQGGRDPGAITYSVAQVICCGRTEAEIVKRAAAIGREVGELRENGLAGTPAEILEKLATFDAAGAERFYLQMLDLSDLDHLQLVAEEVLPHAPGR